MSKHQMMTERVVTQLLEQFKTSLPQLNSAAIFLPNSGAAQDVRNELLRQIKNTDYSAVIPP